MRRSLLLVAAAACLSLGTPIAAAAKPPRTAVFAPTMTSSVWSWTQSVRRIQDVFVTELRKRGATGVLTRSALNAELTKVGKTIPSRVGNRTARMLGEAVGARYALASTVATYRRTSTGMEIAMMSSLISTSTGEIVWADEIRGTGPRPESSSLTTAEKQKLLDDTLHEAFVGSDEELDALIALMNK